MGAITREKAIEIAEALKNQGKKIVLANGVFDLLHKGHIIYLKESKSLGDVLFVAVNSDASVRKIKGEKRPIQDEQERLLIVSSIRWVDYAFLFEEVNVEKVLLELSPHFHAKGGDYTPETVPEKKIAESIGAKTIIAGKEKLNSTTTIISRILEKYDCHKDK